MGNNWLPLRSGTYIRGCAAAAEGRQVTLNETLAERLGYAFALWLGKRLDTTPDKLTIAVGHDSRQSGEPLSQALIKGLTCADSDVYDCALCTTPALVLTTTNPDAHADAAVMVTGSHQAWYMNGFKFFTRDGALTGEDVDEILLMAQQVTPPQRLVTRLDALEMYRASLVDMVGQWLETDARCPLLGLYVVVDAGGGAGGFYAGLLSELGADVTGSINLSPDGRFQAHAPDPQSPDALEAISRAVLENEADLGVIFDADCDRAAIVDQNGRPIARNRLIALASAILLEDEPGATIVTDSVTSSGLNRFITEWGGTHYRFKRGSRNVISEAVRLNEEGINCPLAMETSGHAALRENHFIDDGMYLVTLLLCEAVKRKRDGLTLSSLIDELMEPVESVEIRMNLLGDARASAQSVIEAILSNTLSNSAWHLARDNREGVRISFDLDGGVENAWFQLRLSVHDPVMPLNAESDVPGGVKRMLSELYELLRGRPELDLTPLSAALESMA